MLHVENRALGINLDLPTAIFARKVAALLEMGLDSPATIGFHGTSIEAVIQLIRTGILPGGVQYDPYVRGKLFFSPADSFPKPELCSHLGERERGIEISADMAALSARRHFLLNAFGFGFADHKAALHVGALFDEAYWYDDRLNRQLQKFFAGRGWDWSKVNELKAESEKRRGVVLCLGPLLDGETIGLSNEKHLYLTTPEGLSIDRFVGLEPQGEAEFEFLEELQSGVAKDSGCL